MKTEDIILIIGGLILLGGGLKFGVKAPPEEEDTEAPVEAPVNLLYEHCKDKFGQTRGQPGYDMSCDVNNDGIIDLADIHAIIKAGEVE